ncbi:piggyBac transposable element-derived protein 4 [Trichonephila clavipes]|nr:piggyBac transposable element-derived protein 4 [Trichonephila clavipes]
MLNSASNPVLQENSQSKFWVETTVEELHVFLALNILQGIVKKPGIDHYWSKRYSSNTPFFSKIMSHRRFCLLQRYLHFSDNAAFDPLLGSGPYVFLSQETRRGC